MGRKPAVVTHVPLPASLRAIRAELDGMLALMDRTDALAMQAREIAANGSASYAEAARWLAEQEREAIAA